MGEQVPRFTWQQQQNLPPACPFENVHGCLSGAPIFGGCQRKTTLGLVKTDCYSKGLLQSVWGGYDNCKRGNNLIVKSASKSEVGLSFQRGIVWLERTRCGEVGWRLAGLDSKSKNLFPGGQPLLRRGCVLALARGGQRSASAEKFKQGLGTSILFQLISGNKTDNHL